MLDKELATQMAAGGLGTRRKLVAKSKHNADILKKSAHSMANHVNEVAPYPSDHGDSEHGFDNALDADMTLEDQLTNEKLLELEQIFEEADEDGGGGLDMDEFRNAMRQAMGDNLTDHELDIMFMKVDTNCDGTVDWDEYLSYMLLEYREKDAMNFLSQPKPLPRRLDMVQNMNRYQRHHDTIVSLKYQPNISKHQNNLYKQLDDGGGRYISVTKSGVINFWSMELKHVKMHKIPQPKTVNKVLQVWVTDLVCMPNLNIMCVSTTSGCLVFYDLTANAFNPILQLSDLDICVTCMDFWIDPERPEHCMLIWGDARGAITGLVFDDCPSVCFLQPNMNKNHKFRVSIKHLLANSDTFCGIKAYKLHNVHDDFVQQVKYFKALGCFLSCSRGTTSSLFMGDLLKKKKSYFRVSKGVFAFDYCQANNIIVTGGRDAIVRVWNPYVPKKPVMLLQGHKSAVLHVIVNEKKEQVISISEDKEIHVFDLNTQTCIQSIYRKWVPLGPRPVYATLFNSQRQALLLATNQLAIFEHKEEEINTMNLSSHDTPVNHVLYNDLFNQVVSAGSDSLVCVWDVTNGTRIIQFTAHKFRERGGAEITIEITAMRFDPTKRRLITAARDGTVKIWNFNNGALLRDLEVFEKKEITGIICPKQRILTAGWNRYITIYIDAKSEEEEDESAVLTWKRVHTNDILTLVYNAPSTVASGAYNGDILIWSLETGQVLLRLNAHIGVKPCRRTEQPDWDRSSSSPPESDGEAEPKEDSVFDLENWMEYNVHRASIAAPVPMVQRRCTILKGPTRKGGVRRRQPLVPTFNLIDENETPMHSSHTMHSSHHMTIKEEDEEGNNSNNNNSNFPSSNEETKEQNKNACYGNTFSNTRLPELKVSQSGIILDINRNNNYKIPNVNESRRFDKPDNKILQQTDECLNVNNNNNNRRSFANPIFSKISCKIKPSFDGPRRNATRKESATTAQIRKRIMLALEEKRRGEMLRKRSMFMNFDEKDFKQEEIGRNYDSYMRRNEAAVDKLLFLEKRTSDCYTAILVAACSGGWIRFWSIDHDGGLLGQFNATQKSGSDILAITTDEENEYLITGDSSGYIRVWDISEYCINPLKVKKDSFYKSEKTEKLKRFPLLSGSNKYLSMARNQDKYRPPPTESDPTQTWKAPSLLSSHRGHLQSITDIIYIDSLEEIISTSTDCSIRKWSLNGEFLGIFGQDIPWNAMPTFDDEKERPDSASSEQPGPRGRTKTIKMGIDLAVKKFKNKHRKLPGDIRRVASATTLRVLNGGTRHNWKLAKNIVMIWVPLLRKSLGVSGALTKFFGPEKETNVQTVTVTDGVPKEEGKDKGPRTSVLGNSYKSQRKHRSVPALPKIRQFHNQVDVYSALPLYELEPINEKDLQPPEIVREMEKREKILSLKQKQKRTIGEVLKRNRAVRLFRPPSNSSSTESQAQASEQKSSSISSQKAGQSIIKPDGRSILPSIGEKNLFSDRGVLVS